MEKEINREDDRETVDWTNGVSEETVMRELTEQLSKDSSFSSGKVLGPMYTTPHPIAVKAHVMFFQSNLGNPGLYPGTAALEKRVIQWIKEMLHSPPSGHGEFTSGGSESNITALWMHREKTKKKRVVFSRNAHFSMFKACSILGLEPVVIPRGEDLLPSPGDFEREIKKEGVASVVLVAGTTEFGLVEPISEVAKDAADYGVPVHVDAAFGGFVLPFLESLQKKGEMENISGGRWKPWMGDWDFRAEGVSTITVDPHKMGMSTLPAGVLLSRDVDPWKHIEFHSPYLTTSHSRGMLGTRASGAVAATYAVMRHLGYTGYVEMVREQMRTTYLMVDLAKEKGIDVVTSPTTPLVVFRAEKPARVSHELDKIGGWKVSTTPDPPGIRVVVMPHVTEKVARSFIDDLARVLKHRR